MAPDFSQANRRLRIETPLGTDALLITALGGTEAISSLFSFQAELLGHDQDADFDAIVGQNVTISIAAAGGPRFLNGIVSRFSQSGTVGDHARYHAEIVPWTWFLTRTTDCRIFQEKSVPDIVQQIFGEYGVTDFRFRLTGTYDTWEYCVQYRETDYNFIARLLEEEGIFFFFEHENGKHTLVLADSPRALQPCPVLSSVRFMQQQTATTEEEDVITWFTKEQEVRAGRWSATDYNFETPSLDLSASATGNDPRGYEIYDFPTGAMTRDRSDRLVRARQQEEDASRIVFRGTGYARSFCPGFQFTMRAQGQNGGASFDGRYLLTGVHHRASESYGPDGVRDAVSYSNEFECIDATVQLRPARRTRKPVIYSVQTAEVVGPSGEEIFVDTYGRVKVQFHWDREGHRDENSSCWMRVSQGWAGKNWGMVHLPRVGQEVVVAFLEGDPDQPIVVGRVYNGENMPPYDLPANKTQSGVKSRSTPGGSPANFNEIRFEDKKGQEQVYIHAERDELIVVERNKTEQVGASESISIGYDRSETVGHDETITVQNDRTETVLGNETLTVLKDRTRTVSQNENVTVLLTRMVTVGVNDMLNVGGAQEVNVGGLQAVTVAGAQVVTVCLASVHNVGKAYSLSAGDSITLSTGASSLTMKKDGTIEIKGTDITIEGSSTVKVTAPEITSDASGDHTLRGSTITIDATTKIDEKAPEISSVATGNNTLKGALVKINT
jgi:type VI secretion system secreted protein VgrG